MRLPWQEDGEKRELEQRVEDLKDELEDLREEKERYRKRFEAEKERRSSLSREKQGAQEELKRLKQKLEGLEEREVEEEEKTRSRSSRNLSFSQAWKLVEKLESVRSPEKDLVTVYSPEETSRLPDMKGLKNSLDRQGFSFIEEDTGYVGFLGPDFIRLKLYTRPFYSPDWSLGQGFSTGELKKFIEKEKSWAVVSAGRSVIIKEKSGEVLEKEVVDTRVEKKQKKGGFSQGRFERKRDEQIDEHLEQVSEKIGEDTLLVGEKPLCEKLSGRYMGGFDDNRGTVNGLYGFRMRN
ncbi:MAG: Vms1/Ankzf1 family peptidyl-tRNA hydrolase [Candidatus Nanohalobium sp.]